MYSHHFSFKSLPFENVPDPTYFFDQGDYSRVLNRMTDSLSAGRGLMVLAGPIGTGKTTLSQKLMVSTPQQTKIIWLGEPPDSGDDLLLFITHELNIKPELTGKTFVLRDIKERLQRLNHEDHRCLLIIDESQKISDEMLEYIRLLNNLEQGSRKLMQILLIGQEEFLGALARPELESFKQRIAWLEALGKMTPPQAHEYIRHRLKVAGGQPGLFSDDAIEAIVSLTRGTPRLINSLCDRALRASYDAGKPLVDMDSVRQAADVVGLGSEAFLWLVQRERDRERQAKAALQISSETISGANASAPRQVETAAPVKTAAPAPRKAAAGSEPLATRKGLFDTLVETFSAHPLLQLVASMLLFAASVLFYIVRTQP